ncbi:hypothetical protein [Sanguibacter sp. HDW7]|nr:hypothetical protein [Sanguibacter sp. HDW7]
MSDLAHRLRGWVFAPSAQLEERSLARIVDAIWEHGLQVLC